MLKYLVALPVLPLMLAGCATTSSENVISWGKQDVSFVDYRSDSIACAIAGVERDIRDHEAVAEIERGIVQQEIGLTSGSGDTYDALREYNFVYQRTIRGNVPVVQSYMVEGVHQCLREKGYSEFALTPEQAGLLTNLERGTEARFRYLHALASDPLVLYGQAVQ